MTIADEIQMCLDWYYKMVLKGHGPSRIFDPQLFYRLYHEMKNNGSIHNEDKRILRKTVRRWSIDKWAMDHLPKRQRNCAGATKTTRIQCLHIG